MIFKVVAYFLSLSFSAFSIADVPAEDRLIEADAELFPEYFSYEYLGADGGEILLQLSSQFISQIESKGCSLSATTEVFNSKNDIAVWAQVAGMTFVDLRPSDAGRQKLYVAGLGDNLRVSLRYSTSGCKIPNAWGYKSAANLVFDFDAVRRLDEKQQNWTPIN